MIISLDAEKTFDKILTLLHDLGWLSQVEGKCLRPGTVVHMWNARS